MILTEQDIKALLHKYYTIEISSVERIEGYEDQNFLVQDVAGRKFIAKVTVDSTNPAFLDAQLKAMDHLRSINKEIGIQEVIPNAGGDGVTVIYKEGKTLHLRVLSFLDGTFVYDLKEFPDTVFESLGTQLATMDLHLKDFSHPAAYRFTEWDLAQVLNCRAGLQYIKDHEKRTMADYFLLQYEMEVMPVRHQLRKAVIHNDANDYNVLVSNGEVTGIIDFGDMVETELVNNVAIACTYAMFKSDVPLQRAVMVLSRYHEVYPLTEIELSVYII